MRFDLLVHEGDDLLSSDCFEQLLQLCASGLVAHHPLAVSTAD